jgi:hypothetical protein
MMKGDDYFCHSAVFSSFLAYSHNCPYLHTAILILCLALHLSFSTAIWLDDESPMSRSLFLERLCDGRFSPANTDAFGTNQPAQYRCEQSVGTGRCMDSQNRLYDFCGIVLTEITLRDCQRSAERLAQVVGVTYDSATQKCYAYIQNGSTKAQLVAACPDADSTLSTRDGTGAPVKGDGIAGNTCYKCTRL